MIRRARRGDRTAIAALWQALLESHAEIDRAFALRGDASCHVDREVERALADAACGAWIAEEAGACVGFCIARHEQAPPLAAESSRVAVTELLVERSARRRGVGRALVAAALDWARARGAARVEVRVAARNAEGQAFWRAQGFGNFVDVLDRRL